MASAQAASNSNNNNVLIQPHDTSKDAIRFDSAEESLFKAEHCGRQLETLEWEMCHAKLMS